MFNREIDGSWLLRETGRVVCDSLSKRFTLEREGERGVKLKIKLNANIRELLVGPDVLLSIELIKFIKLTEPGF